MKCVRKVNATDEPLSSDNSMFQFDPTAIFTQVVDGVNIPIFFPIQSEVFEVVSYEPIFFKPRTRSKDYDYYIKIKTKITPMLFDTEGVVERSQTGIVKDSNPNIYRLLTSKFYEYVSGQNIQIGGIANVINTKKVIGRNYIKANRSVYGTDDC